jgi:acyl carrier protein
MDRGFADLIQPFLRFLPGGTRVTADSRLRDLGLDSMHAIQLLLTVEDRYGIVLPDEMLTDQTFETAGSLWQAVEGVREKEKMP